MFHATARVAPEKTAFRPVLLSLPIAGALPEKRMATFWEKYKDPRWQKRRLEVMSDADFSCSNCGDKDSTLNVHHKIYRKGADPWDYPDDQLECLCEPCHEEKHAAKTTLNQMLAASYQDFNDLLGLVAGFLAGNDSADPAATEMGRQASPVFYDIGLAAAAIELEVFTRNHKAARDVVLQFNRTYVSPGMKAAIEDWKGEDGKS